ncbi:MAG: GIY-YIG nuclease family protein [Colwellia sp.]|nr:GIY-YIG nuclease family protein [Colwellia sp.]
MKNKINLIDLIKNLNVKNTKIKFNLNNGHDDPIDLYANNPRLINNQWLFWRTQTRNFRVGQTAICLVRMSGKFWLLTTIKQVTHELGVTNGINYEGQELEEYSGLYGRVVIKYHKSFKSSTVNALTVLDDLEVVQILPSTFEGKDFPGYDKVRLSYKELKTIVDRDKRDWVAALQSQKAVYLINDKSTGKMYVGSATGDNGMLLQRWRNYVSNGHGGNKDLVDLVAQKGFEYVINNFTYSILENYNSRVGKDYILQREFWWMETLGTKRFGYNN